MRILKKMKSKIVSAYRAYRSFDMPLIFHMVINRVKYRHHSDFLRADWPHKVHFLRKHYGYLLEQCRKKPVSSAPNDGPVWVFWWQGNAQMPALVRFCFENLKKQIPANRRLILLHKDNYREFTDIPEYIIRKLEMGIMNLTHFSDIVRMSLLAKHGGLWIDSTVFVSSSIPDFIFEQPYFSGKEPWRPYGMEPMDFTLYLIGSSAGAPWVVFARDMLYEYWRKSWKLLDYLLISHILTIALDSVPELKKQVLECIFDMPEANTLQNRRNMACSSAQYEELMSKGQFFKLSYKLDFKEYDENGNLTYYGMMRKSVSI